MSRYTVLVDEMIGLDESGYRALAIARRNAVMAARTLNVEQFGELVRLWNGESQQYREDAHRNCVKTRHVFVRGPYRNMVCKRCLASYEVS